MVQSYNIGIISQYIHQLSCLVVSFAFIFISTFIYMHMHLLYTYIHAFISIQSKDKQTHTQVLAYGILDGANYHAEITELCCRLGGGGLCVGGGLGGVGGGWCILVWWDML